MKITKRVLMGLGIFILLIVAGVWLFWEQLPIRLVLPYIVQAAIPIAGEIQRGHFTGSEAGEQTYFAYVPEGYASGDQRYKLLYHLHGAYVQESWARYDCNAIGAKMESAVAAGIIEPLIVVCLVDPDGDRMWSDSFDQQYLASTAFTKDLIPHIDATYRTIPERHSRALQGFSMGGFGTVVNGFKAPELFSAIIIWDGALHNWETLSTTREGIAAKMFKTEAYFNEWSPWELTKNVTDDDPDIFMVVGEMEATSEFASRFVPHLENTGREFVYHDVACPHSVFCMLDELSEEAFTFLANSFARQQAQGAVDEQ